MKWAGYSPDEITGLVTELRGDGLSASDAKGAGYTAAQMLAAGYDQKEIGASLAELKAGGMLALQAYDAGFTPAQMARAGYAANGGANSL